MVNTILIGTAMTTGTAVAIAVLTYRLGAKLWTKPTGVTITAICCLLWHVLALLGLQTKLLSALHLLFSWSIVLPTEIALQRSRFLIDASQSAFLIALVIEASVGALLGSAIYLWLNNQKCANQQMQAIAAKRGSA